jgi:pyruvate dehydrogenase E1 component alpha subunit
MNWDKYSLRRFEDRIADFFNSGQIPFPVHLSYGNEEQLIEIFNSVKTVDWIFCSWRSHYQALLKGVPEETVENAILNGKSISLCFPSYRFYSSAIVGGIVPIAVGAAIDIARSQSNEHVWCFLGDMTSETGIAQSCIRFAENFDLPITFVIEDNNLSVMTDTRLVWGSSTLRYEERKSDKVLHYKYKSKFPHAGAGKRVQF